MNYSERLKAGGPLFVQIIKEEESELHMQQIKKRDFLKERYAQYLYNNANLPTSLWAKGILKITGVNKRLNFLKLVGGAALLSDLNEPFIDRQVSQGRVTELKAQGVKQAIRNGAINQSAIDALVGGGTHWAGEKYIQYQYLYDWSYQVMPPEFAAVFNIWFFWANAGAVPYFLPRSLWELKRLSQERSLTKKDILIQAAAVGSNLIPFVSALSTPLLNYPRSEGFFGPLIAEKWRKIKRPFRQTAPSHPLSR